MRKFVGVLIILASGACFEPSDEGATVAETAGDTATLGDTTTDTTATTDTATTDTTTTDTTTTDTTTDATTTDTTTTDTTTDTTTGGGQCDPDPLDDQCVTCVKVGCCDELNACAANTDCVCVFNCVQSGGDPAACNMECGVMGTPPELQALDGCIQAWCSLQCGL